MGQKKKGCSWPDRCRGGVLMVKFRGRRGKTVVRGRGR